MKDSKAPNNQKQEIEARVAAFCRQAGLFPHEKGDAPLKVAVAASGGADSMALLRLLIALAQPLGLEVSACHVNHGLRAAAGEDESFVRGECAALGIPLRVFGLDSPVPAHAGEDWARALRYRCFARLHDEGIELIATAHTVTDQAETLLFRLARGTGLHGAAGIRPQREFYVRPLLCLTRQETEGYCQAIGQRWVTDETNLSDAYARNRLRHYALPALQQANACAEANLARFCEKAAKADEYFERMATELLAKAGKGQPAGTWALDILRSADELILEQAMHRLVAQVRDPEEKYISLLCALVRQGNGAVQLDRQTGFKAENGRLIKYYKMSAQLTETVEEAIFNPETQAEYPLPGGWKLKAVLQKGGFEEKTQDVHKKDLKNQADYARITMLHSALILRGRRPGDKFSPAGRNVTKSLRKWMNETAVPPEWRDSLPLLADGSEIIWAAGGGFAAGLAADEASCMVLSLELEKGEDVES